MKKNRCTCQLLPSGAATQPNVTNQREAAVPRDRSWLLDGGPYISGILAFMRLRQESFL